MKNFTKLLFTFFLALACVNWGYTQPANDLCAGATPIVPSAEGTGCGTATFNFPFSSDGTTDSGVPTVCSTPGLDNWYTWTATSLGLTFSSQSPGNPGIAVFANCTDAASGTDIACLGTFSNGTLTGWAMGDALIIQVYDFSGSTSDIAFCLEEYTPPAAPANNDCANPTPVAVNADLSCTSTTAGTINAATASGEDESTCSGTEDDDVWFSFVATATSHEIDLINIVNGTTDLYHSVWSGSCGALTNILCSDPNSSTASGLTIGDTYLLRVYSWTSTGGQTTDFDVCIGTLPPPPANDACAGAISIASGGSIMGDNTAATNVEALTPCSGGATAPTCPSGVNDGTIDFGAGLWYVYTSTEAEAITIEVDGFDTELQVFTGPCGSFTCVAGDDDSHSGGCCGSRVCFPSAANFAPVDYYIYVDGHGSSTGSFTLTVAGGPLPVELVSFNAKAMEEENMITWSTASEENTEWHIIERSVNGQSGWENIGRVAAAGTSSEIISYEFMDEKPLAVTYYRLRSLDYDGHVDMSSVVRVERERVEGDVNVYPNPTKGTANVEFELAQSESVTVTVTDITGKVISYETINAQRGANNHQIEMGNLSNGIYFISMETSLGKTTERIVKN